MKPGVDRRGEGALLAELLTRAAEDFASGTGDWAYARPHDATAARAYLDAPLDDAGLMLARIYVRLLGLALERLNQAPDKYKAAFLDAMGVSALPPTPARAALTMALAKAAARALVPAGTPVVSRPVGELGPLAFTTTQDLTVLPHTIVALRTIDPWRDSEADQLDAARAFSAFVGATPLTHALHIGDPDLLEGTGPLSLLVRIRPPAAREWLLGPTPGMPPPVFSILTEAGETAEVEARTVRGDDPDLFRDNQDEALVFDLWAAPAARAPSGVGPAAGTRGRWLTARLDPRVPDSVRRPMPALSLDEIHCAANGRLADAILAANAPVDPASPFRPFGDLPELNTSMAMSFREGLRKPLNTLAIHVAIPGPEVVWEMREEHRWSEIVVEGDPPNAIDFLGPGSITLRPDRSLRRTMPAGEGFWFRARVARARWSETPHAPMITARGCTARLRDRVPKGQKTLVLLSPLAVIPAAWVTIDGDAYRLEASGDSIRLAGETRQSYPKGALVELLAEELIGHYHEPQTQLGGPLVAIAQPLDRWLGGKRLVGPPPMAGDLVRFFSQDDDSLEQLVRVGSAIPQWGLEGVWALILDTALNDDFRTIGAGNERNVQISRLVPPLRLVRHQAAITRFAPGRQEWWLARPSFTEDDLPFGSKVREGERLEFVWLADKLPDDGLVLDIDLDPFQAPARLVWDYLTHGGWQRVPPAAIRDETKALTQSGTISFETQDGDLFRYIEEVEHEGKLGRWLRVTIAGGGYGRPLDFEPVDPEDPSLGFRPRPGTGNLRPPEIERLTLDYVAVARPTLVRENGAYLDVAPIGEPFVPFLPAGQLPEPYRDRTPALYVGLDAVTPGAPLSLYLALASGSPASRPRRDNRLVLPEPDEEEGITVEYHGTTGWQPLDTIDGTRGLTVSGAIRCITPDDMAPLARFTSVPAFWLRLRRQTAGGLVPDRLDAVLLNTVEGEQAARIVDEVLGSGTGLAGQELRVARAPVLADLELWVREARSPSAERVQPEAGAAVPAVLKATDAAGGSTAWVRWQAVPTFTTSKADDRHYLLDPATGRIRFGDGERGRIPARGSGNIRARYSHSRGGARGDLAPGAIATLATALAGIGSVVNGLPASGGGAPEDQPAARDRGGRSLRHRGRAVSADDIADIAKEAAGAALARIDVLSSLDAELRFYPGRVTLSCVPARAAEGILPDSALLRRVRLAVEQRAPALARGRLNLVGPAYARIGVEGELVVADPDRAEEVQILALGRLAAFLDPLAGGPAASGWPAGRDVYVSEICGLLEAVPGVDHTRAVRLVPDGLQLRVDLDDAGAPVTARAAIPEGAGVRRADGRSRLVLAAPLEAGDPIRRLYLKGFRAGEQVALAHRLIVDRVTEQAFQVRLDNLVHTPFLRRGARLLALDGRRRFDLEEPATLVGRDLLEVPVGAALRDALAPGAAVLVLAPLSLEVARTVLEGEQVAVDIAPFTPAFRLPDDTLLASLDGRVHLPLAEVPPPGMATSRLSLEPLNPAGGIEVVGEAETLALEGGRRAPEHERVFLDPDMLPLSGRHVLRLSALRRGGGHGA